MKVIMTQREDGTATFQFGPEGKAYSFTPGDDDGTVIAFTKAVNEGIESGVEIEGEAAIRVAEVLKEAGQLAWPAGGGYNSLRDLVQAALPKKDGGGYEMCPWYVQDIALDGDDALVCGYDSGAEENFVIHFTVHGEGAEMTVVLDDRSNWTPVEREFVTKAGRKFSNPHLTAMKEAHAALGKLIAVGDGERGAKDDDTDSTEKTLGEGPALGYTVTKANKQMRYTLGPLYAPMREDAHGEWVEDDTLHKSLHEFVRDSSESGRRINLQHDDSGDTTVGEWVEAVRWPYEHTIKMVNPETNEEHEVEMPAGTIYLGVVWDEDYWDVAKSAPKGLNGYSLGGRAMKVRGTSESLKSMGYKVQKASTPHEYDGGKDGSGACTSCGKSKADGNHTPEPTKKGHSDADIDLAVAVGKTTGERDAFKGLSERLIGVLTEHAKSGVTINENHSPGVEDLLAE